MLQINADVLFNWSETVSIKLLLTYGHLPVRVTRVGDIHLTDGNGNGCCGLAPTVRSCGT
ncbi:hypothetical protein DPMN_121520 [Dreissena polymorpha]|uniref:Uncharacterized protein n=1 Tax=Dreissena polymorpha TaxID=45954 RepID=A0A9D4GQQ1_DREPO|nr:hypothetical protein DPMN_121520 [Dreissena polymorpha]